MATTADSLWSLRLDLASAKLLDRYSRLAQAYRRRGREVKGASVQRNG
jgi:hypothetical protein